MKSIYSILVVWLAFASALAAQELVKIEVLLEQDQFLSNEALVAGVRITNLSGRPLDFGMDNDWLAFSIEGKGKPLMRVRPMPVTGLFTAKTMARTTARFDLAPYYDLVESGNYTVTATVTIKEWGQAFSSGPKRFDIVKGTTLWSQEFGVPDPAGQGGPPEVRKYVLHQARNKEQATLYVRICDAGEHQTYKVFPLGQLLNFGAPDHQLDRMSNLHVLHQNGRQTYNYCVVTPNGEILLRQTYQIASRPKLVMGEDGSVVVAGGYRVPGPTDIPKPIEEAPEAKTP